MKAKTEEFLYLLLWTSDRLLNPTLRNLTDTFETWAYRNGLRQQLSRLERKAFLESQIVNDKNGNVVERLYRLTETGRIRALGGRDPVQQWKRPWDGYWRLVLFDVPEKNKKCRLHLQRYLREHAFGHMQKSVWITPDPLDAAVLNLSGGGEDVGTLATFTVQAASGETAASIVVKAWDFQKINHNYRQCINVLEAFPNEKQLNALSLAQLQRWARQEQGTWFSAVQSDPLLPAILLPAAYLGQQAWRKRTEVLSKAGELIRCISIK